MTFKVEGSIVVMEKILKERRIDWLYHFTRVENLPNIFKFGLLPKTLLESRRIEVQINDEYRYDKCENAICMSAEFPNYRMFYRLRQDNPGSEWAVLELKAEILCKLKCAFCCTNAGSAEVYNIPLSERMGKDAFQKIFAEHPNGPTRKELGIEDKVWYPTDPQAEILVFDKVPISDMLTVYFNDSEVYKRYRELIPSNIKASVGSEKFKYREDWRYWG
jgi:hypothetical protein